MELDQTIEELIGEPIRGRSVNAMFRCPFDHGDNTPSFSIHREEGMWHCFSCGRSGGLEKLARLLGEELTDETRQDILVRSLDLDPKRRVNFAPLANQYIQELQTEQGQRALRDYVARRSISMAVGQHFGLGYNSQKRSLAIPYWSDGTVAGIKYRAEDGSKFAESNSEFTLYNVDGVRGRPVVVLTEGESDCHSVWNRLMEEERGRNTEVRSQGLGIGGTSGAVESDRLWRFFALDLLFARKVFLCYDADDAGDKGFDMAQRHLGDKVIRIRPTRGKDMTEHLLAGGNLDELGMDAKALLV